MRMRVLFVTTGLHTGGAERQLARILERLSDQEIEAGVVSLRSAGPVSREIEALGVPVWHLGLERPIGLLAAPWSLFRVLRTFQPDVINGWMYHGNVAALLARRLAAPRARLVWSVRQSLHDLQRERPLTRRIIRLSARWSGSVDVVVYNSYTAQFQHEIFGFAPRSRVIDNGFDADVFRPDREARVAVRRELNLPAEARLVGLVARYHRLKGHEVFLRAAARLARQRPDVHFLLVGRGITRENPELASALAGSPLARRVHCLGERADIARLTASLDVACSSSWSEAFPGVIGEAMSAAVAVVATDVGDVRRIIGDAGIVVPAGDDETMAQAWMRLLDDARLRCAMGEAGRTRVASEYSLDAAAQRYAALYRELAE